ncbi:hypothetical protein [Neptunomonas antarctica]|uniref:Uncharacterized protein n=1 Tax=Neptunomonas antarctica TaxID=619304 RepID=A0A1N7P9B2_9GAMM|nr:hypothetical protein [Neptunomonas antarctica]SIT07225.1 hypothetical protein SAMN05421760_11363 [Neptunomonas antarctica]
MELFFNKDFLGCLFLNSFDAAVSFSETVRAFKQATVYGVEDYLVSSNSTAETLLSADYTIRNWIADHRTEDGVALVDKELQRFFARKMDKSPFVEEDLYTNDSDYLENEVLIKGAVDLNINMSATLAYIRSGILLSPSLSVFSNSKVDAVLVNAEDEDLPVKVRCISTCGMVSEHAEYIRELSEKKVTASNQIWDLRGELFPDLLFCASVKNQLFGLPKWNVIFERLLELQTYSLNWNDGPFDAEYIPSKASGEGGRVRANRRAINERTFLCPDSNSRVFYWHLRATPGAIRIYFFPIEDDAEKKIIVGYIGVKPYYP